MKYILGRKIEMSQRYRASGEVVPVTIVKAEPCTVTQVKSLEKDGYLAVQLGTGTTKHATKSEAGHSSSATLREFRPESLDGAAVGAQATVAAFQPGDAIDVTGTSKGKGFQGVVKRHHFRGGPASHGHKDNLRMPGSIGAGGHQHVHLGQRMGGRMGGEQVTVTGLEVIEIDAEKNTIAIKGAVPGARGTLLMIAGPGTMTFVGNAAEEKTEAPAAEAPASTETATA